MGEEKNGESQMASTPSEATYWRCAVIPGRSPMPSPLNPRSCADKSGRWRRRATIRAHYPSLLLSDSARSRTHPGGTRNETEGRNLHWIAARGRRLRCALPVKRCKVLCPRADLHVADQHRSGCIEGDHQFAAGLRVDSRDSENPRRVGGVAHD